MVSCICRRWVRQQKSIIEITGEINDETIDLPARVYVWAASPPDRNQSYSGSSLPFANAEMAFGNNSVIIDNHNSTTFQATLLEPNSFYDRGGSVYIPPTIFAKVVSVKDPSKVAHYHSIVSDIATPYRALSYTMPKSVQKRDGPHFYGGRDTLPVRTQYQILLDSAYPCEDTMHSNFWGLKPPQ